jgi:hypothetical protein
VARLCWYKDDIGGIAAKSTPHPSLRADLSHKGRGEINTIPILFTSLLAGEIDAIGGR